MVCPRQHRAEQFPRLACAADDQSFPVFPDQKPGHVRHPLEIIQMPGGHQPVQVHQPGPVPGQQNDVPAFPDRAALEHRVQVLQVLRSREPLPCLFVHPLQAVGCRRGVVHRPVRVLQAHAQVLAYGPELVALQFRIQFPGIGQRIDHRTAPRQTDPFQLRLQQAHVKAGVVRRDRVLPDERQQLRQRFRRLRLSLQHRV